jgi:hypothetical protein
MSIPGFSLILPPETITAAEAVEMVMERFNGSGCTEAEASGWLTAQVRDGKLKLFWLASNPEYLNGLNLTGEGFIFIPRVPEARATDEIDWAAGELRRRVRYPKTFDPRPVDVDPFKMTPDELSARYGFRSSGSFHEREPEEWVTEELRYPFKAKRSSVVAILDRASMPLGAVPVRLSEAAAILAGRFNVSARIGRDAILEAAAAGRIEIYGTSPSKLPALPGQVDPIQSWVWQQVLRGEATLSDDGSALSAKAFNNKPATWSELYVFRADLERLIRDLAGDRTAAEAETGPAPEPPAAAAEGQPEGDASGAGHDGKPEVPSGTLAPRGNKRKVWEAAQRHGRPDFSKHGDLAAYVRTLVRETGVKEATVRNYVTKTTELRSYIERLPEPSPPQKG